MICDFCVFFACDLLVILRFLYLIFYDFKEVARTIKSKTRKIYEARLSYIYRRSKF